MDEVTFGPFRLDPGQRLLTRPGATTALRPKTLDVLLLLLRRKGDVVSKEEIIETVWEGNAVSDYVLTTCISELRAALGERSKEPRYVRTVHRTGYRFVIDAAEAAAASPDDEGSATSVIVGRDRELARLRTALEGARSGQRRIVFVTGEMGIGKTTLADELLRPLAAAGEPSDAAERVARGQCIEQFGAGEPYMPVLEALGRLGREAGETEVVDILERHAPAWLAQIPGLLPPERRAEQRRESPAQTQQFMLRQIADAIEALGERRLLVLLLEDLHCSDHATLELIASLALRRGPAKLLLVGTFRDAETHPATSSFQKLKQQLLLHRQCEEIVLQPLALESVERYLSNRFGGLEVPRGLAGTIRERTEGNPLFIARLVDHLVDDGVLGLDATAGALKLADNDVARHVPRNLRAMIEQRTETLSAVEVEVLETASVAGVSFRSAAIAGALERDREEIEESCAQLSRRHGFLTAGADDGSVPPALGAAYVFSHALYQQVLYERVDVTRRRRLHAAIGRSLRDAWGEQAAEVAAELGSHFDLGGDAASAVEFFDRAAAAAAGRGANREAVGYLDRALALLETSGDDSARRERGLDLLMTRGPCVLTASGYGSAEALDNYRRALDLARAVDNPIRQMSILIALSTCEQTRGNLAGGERLALELIRVGEQMGLPAALLAQLNNPLSQARMYMGAVEEALALSEAAVEGMRSFPMPPAPPDSRPPLWADPRVMLHCQHGSVAFAAGRLARAKGAVEEALRIARELGHPFNQASACTFAALYEDTTGEWQRAIDLAHAAIETARTYDFPFWRGIAQIVCGHAMACSEDVGGGLALLREGIEIWRDTGALLANSNHLNLLADVCLIAGDIGGAQQALVDSEAHAEKTGEKVFLAETYRLQAEHDRRSGVSPEGVEETLQRAIAVARDQGTRLWELRAALARHRVGAADGARRDLARICRVFDGELQTRDIAAARAILA